MRSSGAMTAMAVVAAALVATPALSEPGRGHGKGHGAQVRHAAQHCPPGLAKKNPPCVPPGQARKSDDRFYPRIGDVLRVGDYVVIPAPSRFNLEPRDGWRYYREGNRAYRVDSETRKVLAVIDLINAFTN